MYFAGYRLHQFADIRLHCMLWYDQVLDDFSLALTGNLAIEKKGRQNFFMPEILAPRLELFEGLASILPEPDKGKRPTRPRCSRASA